MTAARSTPGHWAWRGQDKDIRLVALHSGMLYVLGVKARGVLVFRRDDVCLMEPASKFAIPGPAHHPGEVVGLDHPDARLMEAAPDLLAALLNHPECQVCGGCARVTVNDAPRPCTRCDQTGLSDASRAALAKAEGRPS